MPCNIGRPLFCWSTHIESSFIIHITMMLQSIATWKAGGVSKTGQTRYTARDKLKLLSALNDLQQNQGFSLWQAAKQLQVCCTILCWWSQSCAAFAALTKKWRKKKAIVKGLTGILDPVKDALLSWVFELRERGHAIDCSMVVTEACMLLPEIRQRTL